MQYLTNEQIFGFIFFLVICILLAILGGVKQKRPTIPHNDWIKEIVDKCNSYGMPVRTFDDEDKANILTALYHQGYTPVEAIQEFKKESNDEQIDEENHF